MSNTHKVLPSVLDQEGSKTRAQRAPKSVWCARKQIPLFSHRFDFLPGFATLQRQGQSLNLPTLLPAGLPTLRKTLSTGEVSDAD